MCYGDNKMTKLPMRWVPLALALMTGVSPMESRADTRAFKIVDDPALDEAVAQARSEFMCDKPFNRLDVALLVPDTDGAWRRGSFNGDALAYPASCVKLAYLAAAMAWCREHGLPPNHLDHAVRPMVVRSDNVQTGVVVDTITSAPNIDNLTTTSDARWADWIERRLYTARYLDSRGLRGNQIVLHKTYPTNSGEWPTGAEKVAREVFGMNRMQPRLSASLMLEIAHGALEPQARDYMLELLAHDRWHSNSVLGFGLPPGSKYYNKPGLAYDTLEDIAWVVLPNGREFVIAAFSNAFCEPYSRDPDPYDSSQLSGFMELLLEKTHLADGCTTAVVRTAGDGAPFFKATGAWREETTTTACGRQTLRLANAATTAPQALWRLAVPRDGRYEVCARHIAAPDRASVVYTVRHAEGETTHVVDQRRVHDRWIKLGDFTFKAGGGEVALCPAQDNAPTATLCADAVRAWLFPDGQ
jgi:protein phosphatase methylesterase 1